MPYKNEFEKNKISEHKGLQHKQPFLNKLFDTLGYTYQYDKEYFDQLETNDDHLKSLDESLYVKEIKTRKTSALLTICSGTNYYQITLPYMMIDDFRKKVISTIVGQSINYDLPVFVDRIWVTDEVKQKVNIWEFEF